METRMARGDSIMKWPRGKNDRRIIGFRLTIRIRADYWYWIPRLHLEMGAINWGCIYLQAEWEFERYSPAKAFEELSDLIGGSFDNVEVNTLASKIRQG